ncbi:MAG TPA: hypothetical protein DF383_01470, partial [Deltaproteobacteria bacterium]|nr:hypothetical protein [Deltaproteobacteria bacterium]
DVAWGLMNAVDGKPSGDTITLSGYSGNGEVINAMDFNATGALYGSVINRTSWDTDLITIDLTTGAIRTVGSSISRLDAIAFAEPEACDDGNAVAGDGCSSDCKTIETGFTCDEPGQPCRQVVCGDGKVEDTEVCDDGNTVAGDGCSADCQTIEADFTCPPAGGACTPNSGSIIDGDISGGGGCSLSAAALASPSAWIYLAGPLGLLFLRRK